jgi:hypothetical protein
LRLFDGCDGCVGWRQAKAAGGRGVTGVGVGVGVGVSVFVLRGGVAVREIECNDAICVDHDIHAITRPAETRLLVWPEPGTHSTTNSSQTRVTGVRCCAAHSLGVGVEDTGVVQREADVVEEHGRLRVVCECDGVEYVE